MPRFFSQQAASPSPQSDNRTTYLAIGVTFGSLALCGVLAVIYFVCLKKNRRSSESVMNHDDNPHNDLFLQNLFNQQNA